MSQNPFIELDQVNKTFGSFHAVKDLSLTLREGEFFCLLGPSGCGKTTVLRMIAGFQDPSSGRIHIDGQDMTGVPANHRPTNMVFQSYAIFPHLNVGDNVAYGLRGRGLTKQQLMTRVNEALGMVALEGLHGRRATELSGGQQQRVALARALIMRPKVLLLDEPLSALDKKLREQMQFEMRRLQQTLGITFVTVTHDQYEAMTMSDRMGVMFDGRLVQVDAPQTLYAHPCNREVAGFIGAMNFLRADVQGASDTTLTLDVEHFGRMTVPRNPNAQTPESQSGEGQSQPKAQVLVGIRPEQLEVSKDPPESFNGTPYDSVISARVRDVAFYGENVYYHLVVKEGQEPISVSVPNYFHTADFQAGESVWLGVQATSVIELGTAEA